MDSFGYYILTAIVLGGFVFAIIATRRVMGKPAKKTNQRRQDRRRKKR